MGSAAWRGRAGAAVAGGAAGAAGGGRGVRPVAAGLAAAAPGASRRAGRAREEQIACNPAYLGEFAAVSSSLVGDQANSFVTGDFDGDGKLDVATADFNTSSVSVLLGTGRGTFRPETMFAAGSGAVGVAAGDFNGDGKVDSATADGTGGPPASCSGVAMARSVRPPASPPAPAHVRSLPRISTATANWIWPSRTAPPTA